MSCHLLVFGCTGQIARELQHLAPLLALGRAEADLAQPGACAAAIQANRPRAVINAAAYTAVDCAEKEEVLATAINGAAPTEMAVTCAELNIPLVHISTDYVFDGKGKVPWGPNDYTAPINAYGRSKLAGEKGIRASGATHAILRTSWVFSAHGNNFVKTILRLSEARRELNVVNDQFGSPTPARAIAAACLSIARELQDAPEKSGTYHYCGMPDSSWFSFAQAILAIAGRDSHVQGVPSSSYPTASARPLNSLLDCSATTAMFGLSLPDWYVGLQECISELGFSK